MRRRTVIVDVVVEPAVLSAPRVGRNPRPPTRGDRSRLNDRTFWSQRHKCHILGSSLSLRSYAACDGQHGNASHVLLELHVSLLWDHIVVR